MRGGLGTGFLIGAVVGAGALFVLERLKSFNIGAQLSPTPTGPAMVQSHVGILPGNELPFYDYLDDSAPRGNSNVWDRRTSVYRNDGVLYNTVGAVFPDGTTQWHPEKSLNIAGAYGNSLERDERTRLQHAGGNYPECKNIAGEYSC